MKKSEKINLIALRLHQLYAATAIAILYTIPKLSDPSRTPEEVEKSIDQLAKLQTNAETLYEELPDDIRLGYQKMAEEWLEEAHLL